MKEDALLEILENAAEGLGIKLGYEDLRKGVVNTDGGMFVLKGEKRILLHKGLDVRDRVDALAGILSVMDIESLHIPPVARKRIEEARDSGAASKFARMHEFILKEETGR